VCSKNEVNSSKWSVVGCDSARSSNASSTSSGGTKASAVRQRRWFRTLRLVTVNYAAGRVDECSSNEVSSDEIAPD